MRREARLIQPQVLNFIKAMLWTLGVAEIELTFDGKILNNLEIEYCWFTDKAIAEAKCSHFLVLKVLAKILHRY